MKLVLISRETVVERLCRVVLEVSGRFPEVVGVIVFGSFARGDWCFGSDVDVFVIVDGGSVDEVRKAFIDGFIDAGVPLPSVHVRDFSKLRADSLFRAVLREGLVLYAKPPLTPLPAKSLGLKPYSLVKLRMPEDRRKRWVAEKRIYGNRGKGGLLRRFGGEKLAPTLIMVPADKLAELEEEIEKTGATVEWRKRIYV